MSPITLTINQTLDAKINDVFRAWTDGEQIAKWFGPEGFVNTVHEYNATVGGNYRVTMKSPDGAEHTVKGTFKRVDAPHAIEMTWQWDTPGMGDDETRISVTLKEVDDKTEMTFSHSGFPNEEAKNHHNQGWTGSFKKFAALFA